MKDTFIALIKEVKYSPFPGGSPDVSVEHQLPEHAFSLIADNLIANGAIIPPCKVGDTVFKIIKCCEKTPNYKEFYRPSVEFDSDCPHYCPAEWEIDEKCNACADYDDAYYCSLNLDVFCDSCKERFAIQREKFTFSMMCQVFNTPMFDENTP